MRLVNQRHWLGWIKCVLNEIFIKSRRLPLFSSSVYDSLQCRLPVYATSPKSCFSFGFSTETFYAFLIFSMRIISPPSVCYASWKYRNNTEKNTNCYAFQDAISAHTCFIVSLLLRIFSSEPSFQSSSQFVSCLLARKPHFAPLQVPYTYKNFTKAFSSKRFYINNLHWDSDNLFCKRYWGTVLFNTHII